MGVCGNRLGSIKTSGKPSEVGPKRRLAFVKCGGPLTAKTERRDWLCAWMRPRVLYPRKPLCQDTVPARKKMLRAFEARYVWTDFDNHLERGRRIDAVDPSQIDTTQSKQVSSHIELRCILGVLCASTPARIAIIIANKRCQHAFEFGVTFSQQRSIIIIERHRLLECEQMLLAPVAPSSGLTIFACAEYADLEKPATYRVVVIPHAACKFHPPGEKRQTASHSSSIVAATISREHLTCDRRRSLHAVH